MQLSLLPVKVDKKENPPKDIAIFLYFKCDPMLQLILARSDGSTFCHSPWFISPTVAIMPICIVLLWWSEGTQNPESMNDYGTEPQLYKYEFYKFDLNI